MIVYNEDVVNSLIASSLSSLSVIGLYVTIVYAVGVIIRIVFERIS